MSDIDIKELLPIVWTSCDVYYDKHDNEYYAIIEINGEKIVFEKDLFKKVR